MSEHIDAPVELTEAEIALVAGGDAGIGSMTSEGTTESVGGGGECWHRLPSNGFFNSNFNFGANFGSVA